MISPIGQDVTSLSFDEIKDELKTALISARSVALLDGKTGDEKLHLCKLVTLAANKILHPHGSKKPEKKYNQVIDLAKRNIEALIKNIAPQVDAQAATQMFFLNASNAKKSSICVAKGAETIIRYVQEHTQKIQNVSKGVNFTDVVAKQAYSTGPKEGYLLGLGEIVLGGVLMLAGGAIEIGSFGVLTLGVAVAETTGVALIVHGLSLTTASAQNIKAPNVSWKNTEVYAPDRPLPKDKDGVPIPDVDAPHTQLGIKESTRRPGETYPQAREFDKDGNPVKTIDFTDHEEPHIHPNPHEHPCESNPTGGTPKRGDAKPLEDWKY